jgi:hypothetical protein
MAKISSAKLRFFSVFIDYFTTLKFEIQREENNFEAIILLLLLFLFRLLAGGVGLSGSQV